MIKVDVRECGIPVKEAKGIQWLRQEGKETVFQVESGSYHFACTNYESSSGLK